MEQNKLHLAVDSTEVIVAKLNNGYTGSTGAEKPDVTEIRMAFADGQFKQYHVDFRSPLGKDQSQAWAAVKLSGVEQKVDPALFDGRQKTRSIKTPVDIFAEFETIKVKGSVMVSSFVAQQAKAAQDFKVDYLQVAH